MDDLNPKQDRRRIAMSDGRRARLGDRVRHRLRPARDLGWIEDFTEPTDSKAMLAVVRLDDGRRMSLPGSSLVKGWFPKRKTDEPYVVG